MGCLATVAGNSRRTVIERVARINCTRRLSNAGLTLFKLVRSRGQIY